MSEKRDRCREGQEKKGDRVVVRSDCARVGVPGDEPDLGKRKALKKRGGQRVQSPSGWLKKLIAKMEKTERECHRIQGKPGRWGVIGEESLKVLNC